MRRPLLVLGLLLLIAGAILWAVYGDWRWVVAGVVCYLGASGVDQQSNQRRP